MDQPGDSSALVAAISWVQQALCGSVATTVAVLAIAGIGFSMLAGRIAFRRGASIILGCFLIFGAASIANGIIAATHGDPAPSTAAAAPPPPSYPPASAKPPNGPGSPGYDPYAGAAVPQK